MIIMPRVITNLHRYTQGILLVILSSVLTVGMLEVGLNIFEVFPERWPQQFEKYQPARREAHNYASEHGFYLPHSTVPIYAEGSVTFGRIDDFGYLGRGESSAKPNDLLVFGDSFAYGYGVASDKSFAAILHGYNAGVWGEAFPMHATVFRRILPLLNPKRAIWVLYPPHIISCTAGGWTTRKIISPENTPFVLGCLLNSTGQKFQRLSLNQPVGAAIVQITTAWNGVYTTPPKRGMSRATWFLNKRCLKL